MHDAGMPAVGKHFPGHGGVVEDSHLALPVDGRPVRDLMMEDVLPFERMIHYGMEAIMPAHVIYQNADDQPAGFSVYWLRRILREKLGFSGVIFSDDLTMAAAAAAGDDGARAEAALEAGCDVILVCNNPEGAVATLEHLEAYENPTSQARIMRMHGRGATHSRAHLHEDLRWREAVRIAAEHAETSLELNI
jgi:beta-N-acetylhexosaminidase